MRAECAYGRLDPGLVVMAPIPLNARVARWRRGSRRAWCSSGMGARASRRAAARALRVPGSADGGRGRLRGDRPDLRAGDIVLASEIRGPHGTVTLPAAGILAGVLRRAASPVHVGPIVSCRSGSLRSERARLRGAGAIAADTESGWLASGAGGRPFAVLRVVVRSGQHQIGRPLVAAAGGARAHRALAERGVACSTAGPRRSRRATWRGRAARVVRGVERAIEVVERALELHGAPRLRAPQIVHNRHVVEDLEARGVGIRRGASTRCRRAPPSCCPRTAWPQACASRPGARAARCRRHLPARRQGPSRGAPLRRRRLHDRAGRPRGPRRGRGHASAEAPERIRLVGGVEEAAPVEVDDPERVAYLTQTTLAVDETREVVDALDGASRNLVGPRSTTSVTPPRTARTP